MHLDASPILYIVITGCYDVRHAGIVENFVCFACSLERVALCPQVLHDQQRANPIDVGGALLNQPLKFAVHPTLVFLLRARRAGLQSRMAENS